jgi:phosphate-selective porin OprO and OprP
LAYCTLAYCTLDYCTKVFGSQNILLAIMGAAVCFGHCVVAEESAKKRQAIDISGVVMLDADNTDTFYRRQGEDSSSDIELRRAKLTLKYQTFEHWKAKLQLNYSDEVKGDNGFDLGDAHVTYSGLGWFNVRLGKMKEPFSLERLASSSSIPTIERSMSTSAFSPGRSYGLLLSRSEKYYTWALGRFQEDDNSDSAEATTARITFAPIHSLEQTLHLGASASSRDQKGQSFRFKEDAQVNSADNILRSRRFNADTLSLVGIEVAAHRGALRLQSEYIENKAKDINGSEFNYSGYYVQTSYLLNGEHYRYKKGEFKKIVPKNTPSLWELVARLSDIDFNDRGQGSEAKVTTVGASYYWREHVKLMLNISRAKAKGDLNNNTDSGTAVSMRAQYQF